MRPRTSRALLAATFLGGALVASAWAEDVWIKSESVEIRGGKGAVYPVLVTAKKGDQLTVLAREGKWIKVQVGDKEGYVYETALSATKVGSGGNLLSSLGAGGAEMTTASASKGLNEDVKTYATAKKLDPKPLDKLIDAAKAIDPKEWQEFTAAGKVGPDAPAAGDK